MIGDMIAKIRKEKGMSKTRLAQLTNINIGHITHIEKGERNPSHKTLKSICVALDIPYQQLMYTYDKNLNEEQNNYNAVNYISYNKVLVVDKPTEFIDCPANKSSASISLKMPDNSMVPIIKMDEYVFVEFNSPLNNKDIGLFFFNNSIIIRRFLVKRGKIYLKSESIVVPDVQVSSSDTFYIIGKIILG